MKINAQRIAIVVLAALLPAAARGGVVPMINDALPCGTAGSVGGLAEGTEMQRVDLDTTVFPDAVCNDGTPAIFYFRPHSDPAFENHWLIQLQGGGGCGTADGCADRWCMNDTNFSMTQMTSNVAPSGIDGKGIMDRRPLNPVGAWNHVFIRYCSSDQWSGTQRDVELQATTPAGGTVEYRIHFLGQRIVDAVIATLRRDSVPSLLYTQGPAPVELPDLDDATRVILAGSSAGGGGVINNVDRVAETLRSNNTVCSTEGAACPLEVRALIDSSYGPDLGRLSFLDSTFCAEFGWCDWETLVTSAVSAYTRNGDESCVAWHQANAPGTEWQCVDNGHAIRHHVTTPMFVRMGQNDKLVSRNFINAAYTVPGQGPMDQATFAGLVRDQLAELADIQTTAEEGADISVVPGVFGPTCEEHEVLRNNVHIFSATIEVGGTEYAMFDVLTNWVSGGAPTSVITPPGGTDFCTKVETVPVTSDPALVFFVVAVLLSGILIVRRHHAMATRPTV